MIDNLNRTCKDCNFYFTSDCPNQSSTACINDFLASNCGYFNEKQIKKTLDKTLKDLTQFKMYETGANNKRNCFQCLSFNTTSCKYYKLPFRMNTAERCNKWVEDDLKKEWTINDIILELAGEITCLISEIDNIERKLSSNK